jgi:hypothetical protein
MESAVYFWSLDCVSVGQCKNGIVLHLFNSCEASHVFCEVDDTPMVAVDTPNWERAIAQEKAPLNGCPYYAVRSKPSKGA